MIARSQIKNSKKYVIPPTMQGVQKGYPKGGSYKRGDRKGVGFCLPHRNGRIDYNKNIPKMDWQGWSIYAREKIVNWRCVIKMRGQFQTTVVFAIWSIYLWWLSLEMKNPPRVSKSRRRKWILLMFLMKVFFKLGLFPSTEVTCRPTNFFPSV